MDRKASTGADLTNAAATAGGPAVGSPKKAASNDSLAAIRLDGAHLSQASSKATAGPLRSAGRRTKPGSAKAALRLPYRGDRATRLATLLHAGKSSHPGQLASVSGSNT